MPRHPPPPLFDSRGKRLVFKQAYIELTTTIPPTSSIYGLGERTSSSSTLPLRRDGVPLALWARDSAAADADVNTYASWPVAWIVSESGDTHAIALLSSNGMDVVPTADALTFRVTGGVIDLLILGGPTPAAVASQLATAIGFPTLQPLWAFGLMNSKYGYASAAQTQRVLDSYEAASIPLEAWVSDSQYMRDDAAFTWSTDFDRAAMRDFVGRLHASGRRWVPILDPAIRAAPGYAPFDDGVAAGVFVTDITGAPYLGQMWAGATVWPDFLDSDATTHWWTRLITQLGRDVGGVDGVWLDMNEVSNFCSGDVCRAPRGAAPVSVPPNNNFVCLLECEWGPTAGGAKAGSKAPPPAFAFNPPYRVNNAGSQRNLSEKTLAVTARHPRTGALQYDAHNLYGHTSAAATAAALAAANHGRRPFLYTRSSFLGTGRHAGHWTGDTSSSWRDLQRLTPAVLAAGLAGIPFVGGDVCGFMGVATPELCARWVAAAAFHPFARFHHAQGFQEPFRWPLVANATRAAIGLRYRLLLSLYSAAAAATATGCPTARPLFFGWPALAPARDAAAAWMVGDALLVAPVVHAGVESVDAWLPPRTRAFRVPGWTPVDASPSSTTRLPSPLGDPATLLLLPGGVVAVGADAGASTTAAARAAPLTIAAAVPGSGAPIPLRCGRACAEPGAACGDLYLDSGDDSNPGAKRGRGLAVDADARKIRLTWPGDGPCERVDWAKLDSVVLLTGGSSDTSQLRARVRHRGGPHRASAQRIEGGVVATLERGGVALKCPDEVEVEFE